MASYVSSRDVGGSLSCPAKDDGGIRRVEWWPGGRAAYLWPVRAFAVTFPSGCTLASKRRRGVAWVSWRMQLGRAGGAGAPPDAA